MHSLVGLAHTHRLWRALFGYLFWRIAYLHAAGYERDDTIHPLDSRIIFFTVTF